MSTQAVTDIGTTTATGHGTIVDLGGVDYCTKRGVCWNVVGGPTVADDKTTEEGSFGIGSFSANMTGLTPNQHYYVKSYAYNSMGYGYGDEEEFDTNATAGGGNSTSTDSIRGLKLRGCKVR